MVSLADRRRCALHLEQAFEVSERRACRVLGLARSTKRRSPGHRAVADVVSEIHRLSEKYPRFGYRKIYDIMKGRGWRVSRERLCLLRRQEGLTVQKKAPKRRRPGTSTVGPEAAQFPNHVWSFDFVSDQTADGKTLRFMTVIDEHTREGLWIECARSLTSVDVVRVLGQLVELRGAPVAMKSDNGAEFVAHRVQEWLEKRKIGARFIAPGSPWQNGHNESFNGVFRDGCLDRWIFESVREARETSEAWLAEYNHERPHGALGGLTPSEGMVRWEANRTAAA